MRCCTKLEKIYTQDSVCYLIDLKDRAVIDMEMVTHAVDHPLTVQAIDLTDRFSRVSWIQAFAYDGALPLISRDYAAIVPQDSGFTNRIQVSPSFSFVQRMPIP